MTRQEMFELYTAAYKQAADIPTYVPGSGKPIQPASGFTRSQVSVPYPYVRSTYKSGIPFMEHILTPSSSLEDPYEQKQIEDTAAYFGRNAVQRKDIDNINRHIANGVNIDYDLGLGKHYTLDPQRMLDRRNMVQSNMNKARLDRNAWLKARQRSYMAAGQPIPPLGGARPVPFSQKLKAFFSKNPASVIDSTEAFPKR